MARPPLRREGLLPFARPDVTDAEVEAVSRVLRSGWLTSGPEVEAFEREFAARVGARHAIAVSSGTAALHLAWIGCELGPGDGVILPAITFPACAEAVTYTGACPLVVDVGRDDHLLDAGIVRDWLRRECDERGGRWVHRGSGATVRSLMPVHVGGRPCDLGALGKLAAEHGLRMVDDAAHAFPARFGGRPIGSVCDLTAFSFYATKPLTTGEGGMLTLSDDAVAQRLRRIRLHGIEGQTWGRERWHYDVVEPGYKYNLGDVAAAMGRVQLARSAEMHARRKAIDARYRAAFADLPLRPMPQGDDEPAFHLFEVDLDEDAPLERDALVDALFERNVACSLHFIPLYRHRLFRERYDLHPDAFPNAEAIYARTLSLPIFSAMTQDDVEWVVAAVGGALGAE